MKDDSAAAVDAVVLVGGLGTRLRPLTLSVPKPMLPTAGVPMLTHLLARIRDAGVRHIVLGRSYQADVFKSYFGTGERFGRGTRVRGHGRASRDRRRDPQRRGPAPRRHDAHL